MPNKNILFVDDNDNVLSGIRRMLRPYREWQLFFASNGQAALDLMATQPIDLIVSDMMMPGMRGDELLKIVAERYPSAVRIILSGFADEETLKNGLVVAHQFLSKPSSSELLRECFSQVFLIRDCINNPRIIEAMGDVNQFPSLPKIYQELNDAIKNDATDSKFIADIFSRDMALSAKLLQLINSPFFGLSRKISNLTEAVSLIGVKKLAHLVLNAHLAKSFPVSEPHTQIYLEYLWKDAIRTAELARLIAQSENQQDDRPDQAYLGGLLHNLGLLIFLSRGGGKLAALIQQTHSTDITITELEHAIFGFTRSEVAAYVLSLWKIPPRIIESILLQYTPNKTDYAGVNALTTVHVAASLLKPPRMAGDRLFDMSLDKGYIERIDKLDKLPEWQKLAERVVQQFEER